MEGALGVGYAPIGGSGFCCNEGAIGGGLAPIGGDYRGSCQVYAGKVASAE